jgi:hypothetical protein
MGIHGDQYEPLARGSYSSDDLNDHTYKPSSTFGRSHRDKLTDWAEYSQLGSVSGLLANYRTTLLLIALLASNGLWVVLLGCNILRWPENGSLLTCRLTFTLLLCVVNIAG